MNVELKNLQIRVVLVGLCAVAIMFGFTAGNVLAEKTEADEKAAAAKDGDMGNVGAKLANPLADIWSLNMNWEMPKLFDGDVNTGNPRVGYDLIFQPVMPIPLFGEGKAEWRMITRPVIPQNPAIASTNRLSRKRPMLSWNMMSPGPPGGIS